jgi:hypothetical protein
VTVSSSLFAEVRPGAISRNLFLPQNDLQTGMLTGRFEREAEVVKTTSEANLTCVTRLVASHKSRINVLL